MGNRSKTIDDREEMDRRIALFSQRVGEFQRLLGFTDVDFHVGRADSDGDFMARWSASVENAAVSVFYDHVWLFGWDTSDGLIAEVAFHEVFEAQFFKINRWLQESLSDSKIAELQHEIVRRAENHVLPLLLKELCA